MNDEDQHDGRFAGILVINPKGQVFLVKREDTGEWETPGGHVDPGEDFREGAIREFKEEVGVWPEGRWGDFLPGPTPGNPGGCYVMFTLFLINQDNFAHRLNWEHTGSKWVTLGEAIDDPMIHRALRKQLLRFNDRWTFDKGPEDTVEAIMGEEKYADVTVASILKAAGLIPSQMPTLSRFAQLDSGPETLKNLREREVFNQDRQDEPFHALRAEDEGGMPNLEMGDLEIVDRGDLGVDFKDRFGPEEENLTFVNDKGADALGDWLTERSQKDEPVTKLSPEDYSRPYKEVVEEAPPVETVKVLDSERYAGLRISDFREEAIKRDKGGQFSAKEERTPEEEKNEVPQPEEGDKDPAKYRNVLKKAINPAKHLGSAVWNKLPEKSRDSLKKWSKRAAIIGNVWPNAAKAVVAETGAPPYVAKAALIASTVGDFTIPMVPIGSVTTIILATLAKPKAPVKAAKKAIRYIRDKRRERKEEVLEQEEPKVKAAAANSDDPMAGVQPKQSLARTIAKQAGESDNPEWWITLFLVAMEEFNGNVNRSINAADHAIEEFPKPKE